jgi:DNA mismatch repair protein MutL
LPDTLINQIAAGEVVERPASVVKELVENALDAGARRVDIDLEEGGIRLIRIRDDGCGIAAEELPLAISRHATSKIASLDDLESVATLGFRGEALPSIASISRFALSSRRAADAHGAVLRVEGGKAAAVAPAAHAVGTTVEVRDLFYNVPARRKFLRAPRTELGHIEEWLRSLALARPRIDLRLAVDGKPSRRYRAEPDDPNLRVAEALGAEFLGQSLRIVHSGNGLQLHGWIGVPPYSRALGDQQYLYVNGRAVRDRHLGHAAKSAYKDLIFHGRQPAYVLFLELDPLRVDVNVHPAKHEVRFRDARLIYDFVLGGLRDALADSREAHRQSLSMPRDLGAAGAAVLPSLAPGRVEDTRAFYAALYGQASQGAGLPAPRPPRADESVPPLGHALAILHERYLLAQDARGLLAIDLVQAQRRASLQRLRAAHAGIGLSAQPLLLPLPVRVGRERAGRAQAMAARLAAVGVVLERDGEEGVLLRQAPALLVDADMQALVVALLDLAADASEQALLETLAARLPPPARALTVAEMNAWLRDIERADPAASEDAALVRRWTLTELDGEAG